MANSKDLDQYYTKTEIANQCCEKLKSLFPNLESHTFLEPSAGTGSFIDAIHNTFGNVRIKAYDIDPKKKGIKKADFTRLPLAGRHLITVGNPPFGKRSSLAIDFFNIAAQKSDIVAFIVPVQFEKYGVQRRLDKRFKLILSERLPSSAFVFDDEDCDIRCVFQIWTIMETGFRDLRIHQAPAVKHSDFEIFLYNNTEAARKYFNKENYGWNFAVPRQGFYDYTLRITEQQSLSPRIQYMFFKTDDDAVLQRLLNMDFELLSQNNTTTPGFGKADVIKAYEAEYHESV